MSSLSLFSFAMRRASSITSTRAQNSLCSRLLSTSKKVRRKSGKRQRASEKRREKSERNVHLLAKTEPSKAERVAKEGVPDLNEIIWLALFPLLAAGAATAFIPEFRETLFGSHEEANTLEMKTRPLSIPGQKRETADAGQDADDDATKPTEVEPSSS